MSPGSAVDGAAAFVPAGVGLEGLRAAAVGCRGCELFEGATQTVFSAGSATARIALVGEQPGDVEDRRGLPFVGPAGQLLDRAMADAGLDRASAYVTNAVKHFRFRSEAGGRRIHQTPELAHLTACAPWLRAELSIVDPVVVVLLGATAGKALLGPSFRVTVDARPAGAAGRLGRRAGRGPLRLVPGHHPPVRRAARRRPRGRLRRPGERPSHRHRRPHPGLTPQPGVPASQTGDATSTGISRSVFCAYEA